MARSPTLMILLPSRTKFRSAFPPIIWAVVSPCLPASESVTLTAATKVPGFASSFIPANLRLRWWLIKMQKLNNLKCYNISGEFYKDCSFKLYLSSVPPKELPGAEWYLKDILGEWLFVSSNLTLTTVCDDCWGAPPSLATIVSEQGPRREGSDRQGKHRFSAT